MESTWSEYLEWCTDDADGDVKTSYERALKQLETLAPFETALVCTILHFVHFALRAGGSYLMRSSW